MMDPRLIQEFYKESGLANYKEDIRDVVKKIEELGYKITWRYDSEESRCQHSPERWVQISLKKKHPLHIIWDMLHECGHAYGYSSFRITGKEEIEEKIESEKRAWDFADIERRKYSALEKETDNFNNYKKECIETYRN